MHLCYSATAFGISSWAFAQYLRSEVVISLRSQAFSKRSEHRRKKAQLRKRPSRTKRGSYDLRAQILCKNGNYFGKRGLRVAFHASARSINRHSLFCFITLHGGLRSSTSAVSVECIARCLQNVARMMSGSRRYHQDSFALWLNCLVSLT